MIGDKEKSQIDMYDVFGYLVPGFLVVSSIALSVGYWHSIDLKQIFYLIKDLRAGQFVSLLILGLVFSYIVGHVVATISEIVYDRIFVEKIFGYPYESLFRKKDTKKRIFLIKKNFYRSILSIIYFCSLVIIFNPVIDIPKEEIYSTVFVLSFAFVFLLLLKWIENWVERKEKYGFKILKENTAISRLLSIMMWLFSCVFFLLSIPFQLLESIIRNFLGLDRQFPEKVIDKFKERFYDSMGLEFSFKLGTDIYWMTYWYVTEHSPYIRDRLYKFLSLYGLARNSSVALYLSAIIMSIPSYFGETGIHSIILCAFFLFLSFVMSIRYYYLYYNYYSKSLYRSLLAL